MEGSETKSFVENDFVEVKHCYEKSCLHRTFLALQKNVIEVLHRHVGITQAWM